MISMLSEFLQAVRFKNELEWDITIKLRIPVQRFTSVKMNLALDLCATSNLKEINTLIFEDIMYYIVFLFCRAYGSGKEDNPMYNVPGFENCRMKLLRHVPFVDCLVCFLCQIFRKFVCKFLICRFACRHLYFGLEMSSLCS